jgi:tetratricopeptide (TPR) repeat protein
MASQKLKRQDDAQHYWKLYQSFAAQTHDHLAKVYEELTRNARDNMRLENQWRGAQLLAQADELLLANPEQAIAVLEDALPGLEGDIEGTIIANRSLGLARLWLKEFELARACFNRALQLLAQSPDMQEEILCRLNLGLTEARSGNSRAAYEQFSSLLRLKEAQRVSLVDEDQRLLFLQNELGAYMMFISICMELHLFKEALETVEKVKSRVLLDMLSQSNKKPIDYRSLYKIKELRKRREDWDGDLLLETYRSMDRKLEELMEADSEKATEWLYTPIKISEEIETAKQQLQQRNLLLEMESQNTSLSFDDIRTLCRVL